MITFSCSSCREKFEVDNSQAGLMGKCPHCGYMMRVPQQSSNIFQIFRGDQYFRDKLLNKLYVDFLKSHEKIIKHQTMGEREDSVVIELRTQNGRTQLIVVSKFQQGEIPCVILASQIGKIKFNETAVEALRSVDIFSMYTISLDDDNQLWVSNMRILANLTAAEFAFSIINIASFADEMEDDIFGVDNL